MIASGITAMLIAIGPVFPSQNLAQPVSRPAAVAEHQIVSQQPDGYDDVALLDVGQYLVTHGYSPAAAAGVAGCIAGESSGDPESIGSGGGGLIGWTPLPPGLVTGNPSADLAAQEQAILSYNAAHGPVSALNSQTDPVAAADLYSQDFEQPAVTDSDTRPAVAIWVYQQLH